MILPGIGDTVLLLMSPDISSTIITILSSEKKRFHRFTWNHLLDVVTNDQWCYLLSDLGPDCYLGGIDTPLQQR